MSDATENRSGIYTTKIFVHYYKSIAYIHFTKLNIETTVLNPMNRQPAAPLPGFTPDFI